MPSRRSAALTKADVAALRALIDEAAERRGSARVWKLVGAAAWALALLVLGFALNHYSARRSEEAAAREQRRADFVTRRLKDVEAATKAMAPPVPWDSKGGK
jgi:hypothetical protein